MRHGQSSLRHWGRKHAAARRSEYIATYAYRHKINDRRGHLLLRRRRRFPGYASRVPDDTRQPPGRRNVRILTFLYELSMGGSQINAIEISAEHAKLGHEVIVYAPD